MVRQWTFSSSEQVIQIFFVKILKEKYRLRHSLGLFYSIFNMFGNFILTDDGRVIKAVNRGMGKPGAALFTEEIQISNTNAPIKSLSVIRNKNETPKLLIITNEVIYSIPLYRCSRIPTCRYVHLRHSSKDTFQKDIW